MRGVAVNGIGRCVVFVVAATTSISMLFAEQARGHDVPEFTLDSLSATREKPLFSPSRQKPPPAIAPVAAPEPDAKQAAEQGNAQFELVGIITGANAITVLLRNPKKDELIKIQSGERVGNRQ